MKFNLRRDEWKDWLFVHWRAVGAALVGLCLLVGTVVLLVAGHPNEESQGVDLNGDGLSSGRKAKTVGSSDASGGVGESAGATGKIAIDIEGAVNHPGLYEFESSAVRLRDAIDKAGGLTEQAERKQLNLAEQLSDGMAVYLPAVGEEAKPFFQKSGQLPGGEDGAQTTSPGKVSLNHTSQKELEALDGIGPKKAEQIIAYRNQHPFTSVDQLKEISGIGEKRFDKLKDQVAL